MTQGKVSGQSKVGQEGQVYYEYLGIPYAQPPIAGLRFRPPLEAAGWSGIRDGTQHPPACPQIDLEAGFLGREVVEGNEDCLYLNVYTPATVGQLGSSYPLPVMVYIHGGSFTMGSIEPYNPSPLMLHNNVIVVTIQYRLGILGFASTGDEVLPGNLGLKDQTLALKWVQRNIESFGGDPMRVTVFGESAGSASAHLHVMSPHSRGLFQRLILQSGTALSPWVIGTNHRELAFKLGEKLNCGAQSSSQLLSCLNRTSLHDIVFSVHLGAEYCLLINLPDRCIPENVWNYRLKLSLPRIDGDFLPDHPAKLMKDGRMYKVDVISGVNQHEGISIALTVLLSQVLKNGTFRPRENAVGASGLLLDQDDEADYLATRVAFYYLPNLNISVQNLDGLTSLFSDRIYTISHQDTATIHTQAGHTVYQYRLIHRGEYSYTVFFNTSLADKYTAHVDDLLYIFDQLLPDAILTRPEDLFIRYIMTRMWTNFARTGNPTVNGNVGFRWETCGSRNTHYLAITTKPGMRPANSLTQNMWRSLPTKSNRILFPENFYEDSFLQYSN
ncbi:hypothetical protein Pcinc_020141 [Petrolisthes cinctipes]|uniref:Carboxylic ester hydrolase n=1 Tax=Petrolisthes cinctipes TaxID=88211 RepID=A0AAE1FKR4_PETCI|nr:hypothetical protein Pcinc_020141 [Petrolisthes cinctipes]